MEELVKPGDLVLVSNRYETQMCAIDCGAQAIIVCCGSAVPRTIVARAQEKGCAVLATPLRYLRKPRGSSPPPRRCAILCAQRNC